MELCKAQTKIKVLNHKLDYNTLVVKTKSQIDLDTENRDLNNSIFKNESSNNESKVRYANRKYKEMTKNKLCNKKEIIFV